MMGLSDVTFYNGKKKCGGLELPEGKTRCKFVMAGRVTAAALIGCHGNKGRGFGMQKRLVRARDRRSTNGILPRCKYRASSVDWARSWGAPEWAGAVAHFIH